MSAPFGLPPRLACGQAHADVNRWRCLREGHPSAPGTPSLTAGEPDELAGHRPWLFRERSYAARVAWSVSMRATWKATTSLAKLGWLLTRRMKHGRPTNGRLRKTAESASR